MAKHLETSSTYSFYSASESSSESFLLRFNKSANVKLLPIETAITYNSRRPYSFKDRSFWAGKGFSSSLTLGIVFESRFFSVQIAPEFYHAQNLNFNSPFQNDKYYGLDNVYRSDLPYRLENSYIMQSSFGESFIRIHFGWFEIGTSTTAMSWGSGLRNQIIFGQHAPGLKRIYSKSNEVLNLPFNFGNLNYEFIWAWPENSIHRKESRNRFITGFITKYQPHFIEGIEIGLSRIYQTYIPEHGLSRAIIFEPFESFYKKSISSDKKSDRNNFSDQMASVYMSYTHLKSGTKIFGEFIREDHNWDIRDAFTNPHNSRGFQFGIMKWFDGNMNDHKASLLIEITNASSSNLDQIRGVQGLYIGLVTEGHTNKGQYLGSDLGPGGTSFYIALNRVFNDTKIRFSFEKVELNEYGYFESLQSFYKTFTSDAHRVNLHYGVDAMFNFRGFILEPRVMGIQYFNEGWDPERDFWNWHLRLGVTYPF